MAALKTRFTANFCCSFIVVGHKSSTRSTFSKEACRSSSEEEKGEKRDDTVTLTGYKG